jgi:uncharacterized damage-inducible protein DinB
MFGGTFMSSSEATISFRELLAYTDYLAKRWVDYFRENSGALDINIGGKTGSLSELVQHIFMVEQFFANRLLQKEPPAKLESPTLDDLMQIHKTAHVQLLNYAATASDEDLHAMQSFGPVSKSSNRKILAQTVLHSVHHWAQVAIEVRQAGFPVGRPQDIIITDVME